MKDYDKTKELSCLKYQEVNNLPRGKCQKSWLWVENTSLFNEDFIKS